MDHLAAIRAFAQVVESGSFAKAAGRLGMSTTAISRHVGDLEAHLQTRLLNRTTRKVSLTEGGRAYYERVVQLLADLDEAEQEASRAAVVPRGVIKLTTAVNFGVRHVAPHQRRDGAPDIVRLTPAALGDEPVGDAMIVDVADAGGHVGRDDTGPHLEDRNRVFGQPRGE